MERLEHAIGRIRPLDEEAMAKARDRLDRLTKPPGSLGRLEELAVRLAGMTGSFPLPGRLARKAIVVMAGDHGVCEEGVSAFPQEVTPQMVRNFLAGGAAVNVLAGQAGADVVCVDMGMKADVRHERLRVCKVKNGTDNMTKGPAMSREEAVRSVEAGIAVAEELAQAGYGVLATGEMGIGNTTPSAAMLAVFAGADAEETVGRGTGVDDAGLARKRDAVRRAIAANRPDGGDALDVLAKVGGLEIAGLAGLAIGAAASGVPLVIDGFISTVAALAACRLAPGVKHYLIASHLSDEKGHRLALELIGLSPMLHLSMRLGEGTGAALAMPLIDAAKAVTERMATFESAGVSRA
jgi:nicotinate-nucleotide--dimethylbenzimidazole phosphoribosyltransferase